MCSVYDIFQIFAVSRVTENVNNEINQYNSEFSVVSVDEKTVLLTLTEPMMEGKSGSDGRW